MKRSITLSLNHSSGFYQEGYASTLCTEWVKRLIGYLPETAEFIIDTQPFKGGREIKLASTEHYRYYSITFRGETTSVETLHNLRVHLDPLLEEDTPKRFYVGMKEI